MKMAHLRRLLEWIVIAAVVYLALRFLAQRAVFYPTKYPEFPEYIFATPRRLT